MNRVACWVLLLCGGWTGQACANRGPLVDLDASHLAPGPLSAWPNRGSGGGQFAAIGSAQPSAVDVDGRRAVRFDGAALASSFPAPAGLTGNHEFSLLLHVRAEKLAGKQVVVSWASRPWDSAEFAYGTGGEGAYCSYGSGNFGFGRAAPPAQAWHHLAFVYEPGRFAVYGNGELLVQRKMTLKTKPNEPIRLGTAWDHLKKQPCFPFPGELASVKNSWDWDHVHLVQLNLFAGAGPADVASVTARPHDPENALAFLREDLETNAGASGRPVVIFQHFGLPPDGMSHWWQAAARDRFREAVRPYHVAAVIHGHSHAGTIYQWKGLRIIADGSTQRPESGGGDFFVIRITKDEFLAAHRLSDRWGECIREPIRHALRESPPKALGGVQPNQPEQAVPVR